MAFLAPAAAVGTTAAASQGALAGLNTAGAIAGGAAQLASANRPSPAPQIPGNPLNIPQIQFPQVQPQASSGGYKDLLAMLAQLQGGR